MRKKKELEITGGELKTVEERHRHWPSQERVAQVCLGSEEKKEQEVHCPNGMVFSFPPSKDQDYLGKK